MMDTLHGVLAAIRTETKSDKTHLSVFRQFLAHLDQLQRKAPERPARVKPPERRKPVRRGKV